MAGQGVPELLGLITVGFVSDAGEQLVKSVDKEQLTELWAESNKYLHLGLSLTRTRNLWSSD